MDDKKPTRILLSDASPEDKLEGKVIDKIALTTSSEQCENLLIMTFKDGDYIALCVEADEIRGTCVMRNAKLSSAKSFLRGKIHADDSGVIIDECVERVKSTGIIGITDAMINSEIARVSGELETEERIELERLKAKYEDDDKPINDND